MYLVLVLSESKCKMAHSVPLPLISSLFISCLYEKKTRLVGRLLLLLRPITGKYHHHYHRILSISLQIGPSFESMQQGKLHTRYRIMWDEMTICIPTYTSLLTQWNQVNYITKLKTSSNGISFSPQSERNLKGNKNVYSVWSGIKYNIPWQDRRDNASSS